MKTNEEKLAIYKAYLEGKVIESVLRNSTHWVAEVRPSFNYDVADFRVAPEPVKPAVARAFKQRHGGLYWTLDEGHKPFNEDMRAPEFDIIAKEAP